MSTMDPFEARMAAWLEHDAVGRVQDHLDEVLMLTAATSQSRGWTWRMPLHLPLRFGLPAVVAVVALAVVLLASVIGGQEQTKPPHQLTEVAPRILPNGPLAISADRDLFLADPDGRNIRPLVVGPTDDRSAGFSPDGRRLAFGRWDEHALTQLFVINRDGSSLEEVYRVEWGWGFPDDDTRIKDWSWAPDGTRIAVLSHQDGRDVLSIVDLSAGQTSDVSLPDGYVFGSPGFGFEVAWHPGGDEILVTGSSGNESAVYALALDGSIGVVFSGSREYVGLSPTGRWIGYSEVVRNPPGFASSRAHLVDLSTGVVSDLVVGDGPNQAELYFSPDGETGGLVVCSEAYSCELVVMSIDGLTTPRSVGSIGGPTPKERSVVFSPDGRVVAVNSKDAATVFIDIETGEQTSLALGYQVQAWAPQQP